jgi:hypothetical protein
VNSIESIHSKGGFIIDMDGVIYPGIMAAQKEQIASAAAAAPSASGSQNVTPYRPTAAGGASSRAATRQSQNRALR